MPPETVYVSGSRGFVGANLTRSLRAQGFSVRDVVRTPKAPGDLAFDLANPRAIFEEQPRGAYVHCAWSMNESARTYEDVNVRGSIWMLEHARRCGMDPIVFISTTSVYPACRSLYGRSKQAVEEFCRAHGIIVVRAGFVFSRAADHQGGIAGKLDAILRLAPIVPLFDGGKQTIYVTEADDFAAAIGTLVRHPSLYDPTKPVLARTEPLTFRQVLESLAHRLGKKPRFFSVPLSLVRGTLRVASSLKLPLPVSEDNLEGLVGLPTVQPVNAVVCENFRSL